MKEYKWALHAAMICGEKVTTQDLAFEEERREIEGAYDAQKSCLLLSKPLGLIG